MSEYVEQFPCMGCTLRLVIGAPSRPGMPPPAAAAGAARRWLESYDRRLSRFREDNETAQLNRDGRQRVPVSPLMCSLVGAGLWAAQRSGGLVDPTLLHPIERAGYAESRADRPSLLLAEALDAAPPPRPASPDPAVAWRQFHVDARSGVVDRPPGLMFDPGGVGKGLAADAVACQLEGYSFYAIDCAGDLHVGGASGGWTRYFVNVADPLTGGTVYVIDAHPGAVATSGLGSRLWRRPDGSFGHHLLDPATGEPAWTGLVSATAIAHTTLEAETLAKMAFLLGPAGARKVLHTHGGVTIDDRGRVELHGPLARPRVRIRQQVAA